MFQNLAYRECRISLPLPLGDLWGERLPCWPATTCRRGFEDCSSISLRCDSFSALPLVFRLGHGYRVGIAEIADVDPEGFPGGDGGERGDHRDAEGNRADGDGD